MKKRYFAFSLITVLSFILCASPMISIEAHESDEVGETDDISNSEANEETNYESFNDEGLIPDSEDNGRESWFSGITVNPLLRSFENSYHRNATVQVLMKDNRTVYDATDIYVIGYPYYNPQYNVPALGRRVNYTEYNSAHEISSYSERNFTTTKTLNGYSVSWDSSVFDTGVDIPAGTYKTTRQAIDMIEITYNGRKYWVSPQFNGGGFSSTCYGYFTESKKTLSVNSVNGVPINQMMMPVLEQHRTGFAMNVQYITIHNTANSGWGANAFAHANLQKNRNDAYNSISWHYTVDNTQIYQSMPMNEVGWHAGDGLLAGNASTIGVEICENADGNYAQAERNAAYLTAQLLYENGLPSDAIRLHRDWSGKNCAHNIIEGTKGTMGWEAFKNLVKQEYDKLVASELMNNLDKTIPSGFESFITSANLTFSEGMTTGYTVSSNANDIAALINKADPTATVKITNDKGVISSGKIATGQVVTITKADGTQFKFAVVIKGDVNGDGEIYATDYVKIKNYIMSKDNLGSAYKLAADVNKDGNVYATDYVKIKNYIMGRGSIEQ